MHFIKLVISKIGTGFLYGLGFVVAATLIGNAAFSYIEDDIDEKVERSEQRDKEREEKRKLRYREYDESAKLSASITKERVSESEFTLLGVLENKGDARWSSINIKAELFNAEGEFIDECSEYITQNSLPGSKLNFKLSCGSCSKFQLGDYRTYKLSVVSARYRS